MWPLLQVLLDLEEDKAVWQNQHPVSHSNQPAGQGKGMKSTNIVCWLLPISGIQPLDMEVPVATTSNSYKETLGLHLSVYYCVSKSLAIIQVNSLLVMHCNEKCHWWTQSPRGMRSNFLFLSVYSFHATYDFGDFQHIPYVLIWNG